MNGKLKDFIDDYGQWLPLVISLIVTAIVTVFLLKHFSENKGSGNYSVIWFIDLCVFTGTAYSLGWLWRKIRNR